ncbi:helix-turn-helix domain-containing protein [Bacillus hwajinpoensis]|jgi:excisionase family DNA binding protein|uniref:Helix-turn-helix domain-containing protein n=1 Tax=Guptibacillus hwajinpoensis TaxID=208199 RepID=A0A845F4B7_9BACL|nr:MULTISPECIES: helix-turn-helix domain-containing protein [Bacillaceae]MBF0706004.1 helix-turn-helix domain-containing protein [Pseudalkalibacillus hwajinpoensis]MBF0706672.1 helix-turn-helix domain-containing protein [Pseudalkalibacillus hwajinpoensis]MYL65495.1 helix-turn-helix domain-containing protein [Pseudalkalibacillus hwajinpoensis]PFG14464.1 excisionase family DNA binding protein [Bacillus sp. es.036]
MERRTLTVNEAADYLGVCNDTIYTMVRTEEIPHFRIRRRIFFSKETIDIWVREQEMNHQVI